MPIIHLSKYLFFAPPAGTRNSLQSANSQVPVLRKFNDKINKIFLISKEIQSGAVAKSYMRKGFVIYEDMRKSYMRRPLVIYDLVTAPFWISFYMRIFVFFFISVVS